MSKYIIKEVKTSRERKDFLKMVYPLYFGCDDWLAPLETDIDKIFDEKKNKMFNGGQAARFLVFDTSDKKYVGRIAVFYNISTQKQGKLNVGGCGFFESIDSQQVANMLFDRAKQWLEEKGMDAMDGPINFGDRENWWGLLTDGHSFPNYGMGYHHPYYKELFENYGFKNYFEGYTFVRSLKSSNINSINSIVQDNAKRLERNPAYKFTHINKNELGKIARDFCEIYSKAWERYDSVVAKITLEDANKLIKKLRPIMDEKLIYFAYHEEKPIGFFVMIPDLNTVIKPFNGKMNLINLIRLIYRLKIKKIAKNAIGIIFGVIPEFQGKGVESGMIDAFRKEILKGSVNYESLTLTWIGDFNPLMIRVAERYVQADKDKTYTTYRYIFDRTYPFERAPKVSISRKRD